MKTYTSLLALGLLATSSIHAQDTADTKSQTTQKQAKVDASAISPTQIITANRMATDANEIGKSYSIVTAEEIKNSAHKDLLGILKRVPGLHFTENGPHGTSSIFIRGHEGYHTKLLYNGVPLEDASGTQVSSSSFINSINLDNVERIEIIRGSQSVLHGSDAIGGVINIITKKGGEDLFSGSARQEFGANKYAKSTLSIFGSEDQIDYSFSVGHESENTFSTSNSDAPSYSRDPDGDAYRNTSGNAHISYFVNDNVKLSLSGNYIDSETEYDIGETHVQLGTFRPELSFTELLDGKLDSSLAFSHTDSRRGNFNTSYPFFAFAQIQKYEFLNTYRANDMHTLTFGIDSEEQRVKTGSTKLTRVRFNEYFLQDHIVFNDTYSLTAGTRFSSHSQSDDHLTWQVAPAAYFAESGTRLHASAGTGFRAPSVNELFGPFGSDPKLQPEESESYDLGIEQAFYDGEINAGLTAFYNTVDDAIVYSSGYANVNHLKTYGLESFIDYQATDDLFLKATYTRMRTESKKNNGSPTRLVRRPNDSATFLANYQATETLNINLEINYNGSRKDTGTTTLDDYVLAEIAATYEISENLEIFARIHNLLDEDYEYARGYNTRERTYYAGLEYSF